MNFLVTSDLESRPGVRRRTLSQQIRVGSVSLATVVILLTLAVTLIYLAHANRVATRGYVIKKLEAERRDGVTALEIWRQQVAESKSIERLADSPEIAKMVPVKNPVFIELQPSVAKK